MGLPPYPDPPIQHGVCANVTPHQKPTDSYRLAIGIVGLLDLLFCVISTSLFLYFKKSYLKLQERSSYMVVYILIGNFLMLYVWAYREVTGRDHFPCLNLAFVNSYAFSFVAGPVVASLYVYIFKVRRRRMLVQKMTHAQKKLDRRQTKVIRTSSRSGFCHRLGDFIFVWRITHGSTSTLSHQTAAKIDDMASAPGSIGDKGTATQSSFSRGDNSLITRLLGPRFYIDCIFPSIFCALSGFPYMLTSLIRVSLDPFFWNGCLGCERNYLDYVFILVSSVVLLTLLCLGVWSIRKDPDPTGLRSETITNIIVSLPFSYISWGLEMGDPNGISLAYKFQWQIFQIMACNIILFISSAWQVALAIHQRRVLMEAGKFEFDLDAILDDDRIRGALLKHCNNELSSENVLFLVEVRSWKNDWNTEDAIRLIDRAKAIHDTYVSTDSELTINISHSIRSHVSGLVNEMSPETKPDRTIFDRATRELELLLHQDTLPRFRKSNVYEKEIVQTGLIDKISKLKEGGGGAPGDIKHALSLRVQPLSSGTQTHKI